MMMIATMAMFAVSCDKEDEGDNNGDCGCDNDYGLSGDQYIGTLTTFYGVTSIGETTDYVLYADGDVESMDIMMPSAQFVSAMPAIDMAILEIALQSQNPDYYYHDTASMVGIYDHNPLINDVVKGISNVEVTVSYDGQITVSFICSVSTEAMGDLDAQVIFEGVKSSGKTTGFYVGKSSGTVEIADVTLTYYSGDNTLVVDGFSFSDMLDGTTLAIKGLSADGDEGFITGENLGVSYAFMGAGATGTVTSLLGDLESDELTFSILAAMGGSGEASSYNCSYYGEVTVVEESYEGFYITISTGVTSRVDGVTVEYYQGDNTLVIDGFKFNTAIPMGSTIPIDYITEISSNGLTYLAVDGVEVEYTVMYQPCSSMVTDLTCTVIDQTAELEFWIMYNDFNYPCSYIGEITTYEGSYDNGELE